MDVIHLCFNDPSPSQAIATSLGGGATIRGQMSDYDYSVDVLSTDSLKQVKERMASVLGE